MATAGVVVECRPRLRTVAGAKCRTELSGRAPRSCNDRRGGRSPVRGSVQLVQVRSGGVFPPLPGVLGCHSERRIIGTADVSPRHKGSKSLRLFSAPKE